MRLNHPTTVWRKWKAASAERETLPQAAPSGWGGAIETLIAAKREGAFLKMTDVDPVLCRFSDAGKDELTPRHGGRRPKSAKARNRGKWSDDRAAGSTELWRRARCEANPP
jgi:hypothetical protein